MDDENDLRHTEENDRSSDGIVDEDRKHRQDKAPVEVIDNEPSLVVLDHEEENVGNGLDPGPRAKSEKNERQWTDDDNQDEQSWQSVRKMAVAEASVAGVGEEDPVPPEKRAVE